MNRKFKDAVPDFEQQRKVVCPIHFITKTDELPPISEEDDTDDSSGDSEE